MNSLALRLAPLLAVLVFAGCANIKLDATGATPATVEKLRSARLAPAQVGAFRLAPGKDPAMDTSLSGLRGNSLAPAKGTWSQLLKDTVLAELTAAGLVDPASSLVIEGLLTDSKVDAAIGTGTGRLAARFIVKNGSRVAYDKELAADAQWESSFVGAVAIPAAMNQYGALYKSLVAKLVDDPDFRRALTK
jgi:hypothetical protein